MSERLLARDFDPKWTVIRCRIDDHMWEWAIFAPGKWEHRGSFATHAEAIWHAQRRARSF